MSLQIQKTAGASTVLTLSGRLDTSTAPELESALEEVLESAQKLTLDLEKLEYISSAGLRIILKAQKAMNGREGLVLTRVPEAVMEVFDITGFSDFLTIEK